MRFQHVPFFEVHHGVKRESAGNARYGIEVYVLDVAVAAQQLFDIRPVNLARLIRIWICDARFQVWPTLCVEFNRQVLKAHASVLLHF
jgi:hypothetical protein